MKLEHSFHVDADVDLAWDVLNDVRRVALCMPGASVDTVDGDLVTGSCKIKLGPISLTYRGQATFIERDSVAHRIVLDGQGRDGSNGRATVAVVATLQPEGTRTRVDLETDLKLTGRAAQFGRGVLNDVGDRIIGQFAAALADELAPAEPEARSIEPAVGPGRPTSAVNEPLDLGSVAGKVLVRHPLVIRTAVVFILLVALRLRRSSRRRPPRR